MLCGALEQKTALAASDLQLEGMVIGEEVEHACEVQILETLLGASRMTAALELDRHAAIIATSTSVPPTCRS
jgi:hypothetical protein